MNRRQIIKHITVLTGVSVIGGELFLSGCKSNENQVNNFSQTDIDLFDEIAETILPETDTPGAKEAEVGKFMALYTKECYVSADFDRLKQGLIDVNKMSKIKYGHVFTQLNSEEKHALLEALHHIAEAYNKDESSKAKVHYYTMIKQLILLGFFTSELGMTKVLRYSPAPGEYIGVVPYVEGEASWA
jgi:hypothetical protein